MDEGGDNDGWLMYTPLAAWQEKARLKKHARGLFASACKMVQNSSAQMDRIEVAVAVPYLKPFRMLEPNPPSAFPSFSVKFHATVIRFVPIIYREVPTSVNEPCEEEHKQNLPPVRAVVLLPFH
jgi:hypothetical protein